MKQKILLLMTALFSFAGGARAVNAFTKHIDGGGYYLIASPIGEVDPWDVINMFENGHDLYSFDPEEGNEWRNYYAGEFDNLEPGRGYLYANSDNVTLTFVGSPFEGNEYSIDVHEGWNLLGNPFIEDVYLVNEEGGALTYYVLNENEGGDHLVDASEENSMRPISPMEGFFYYAEEEGTVYLVKEVPGEVSGEGKAPDVNLVLPEHGRDDNQNGIGEPEPTTLTQTIELRAGWNWVSFNVDITLDDLKAALMAAVPGTGTTIKSQDNITTYYNGTRWIGRLNSLDLDLTQMYKIKVESACEITLEGMPINPAEHPVPIKQGDNWIGFPLNGEMPVTNVFDGFAQEGDIIKSKTAFAVYTGTKWRGTLQNLTPGQGYVYESAINDDRIFDFPSY